MVGPIVEVALLVALVSTLGVVVSNLYTRVSALERRERDLWAWARAVVDLYYRYRKEGSPDPPDMPD